MVLGRAQLGAQAAHMRSTPTRATIATKSTLSELLMVATSNLLDHGLIAIELAIVVIVDDAARGAGYMSATRLGAVHRPQGLRRPGEEASGVSALGTHE